MRGLEILLKFFFLSVHQGSCFSLTEPKKKKVDEAKMHLVVCSATIDCAED